MTKEITEEKAGEKKGKSDTNVTLRNKDKGKQADINSILMDSAVNNMAQTGSIS